MHHAVAKEHVGEVDPKDAIEPDLPIVDPHHHLWHPFADRYFADAFQNDILSSGHNVTDTVYVECSVMNRVDGPAHLRSVGEAEFVSGMAAMGASKVLGPTRICAGFVGAADLAMGAEVSEVLDALQAASGGRLRGVRGVANWDADPSVNSGSRPLAPKGLLLDKKFQEGAETLTSRGYVYDAWQYFPQLGELTELSDRLPNATIVVNHCGGLLGVGAYSNPENFGRWKALVAEIAKRENVLMKLGGLSGRRNGFGYDARSEPPTLDDLVSDWKPFIETCIEFFGANRCMFESNFPVDAVAGSYQRIWNAFKTIASACSADEKTALFSGTAKRAYRI
ncbi:amidohydrolase [Caballeronia calidae]|uniref:Amidohydrolase n=1 Tax=Caballeronia calidae TaxID=1777139 RepID=A0A158EFE1_9BURK|nr:amidohydrolase family protein [Caballeronia calidae]SAL05585.1 amidohydrolase [Caballeronia calidae]